MWSKPGRSDVLLALRTLVDKVGQGLESMVGGYFVGKMEKPLTMRSGYRMGRCTVAAQ